MDPMTGMMIMSMGMQMAGGVMEGYGNLQSLNAQAEAYKYNANMAHQNAVLAKQQSVEDARRLEIQGQKALGSIRAATGASGVQMEGSPLDVLEQSARNVELDRLTVLHAGQVKAISYENQAQLNTMGADSANSQQALSFLGPLLSGGGNAASTYMRFQ
jgi:hypothetical protein